MRNRTLIVTMMVVIGGLTLVAVGCGSAPQAVPPTPTATPREFTREPTREPTTPVPTVTPRVSKKEARPTATQPQIPSPDEVVHAAEEEATADLAVRATADLAVRATADLAVRATADLAVRLQMPPEDISVVGTERVEWPDTGLGCPEPGQMYAEVVTPGHVIILSVGGETYEYHIPEHGGEAVLCMQKGDQTVSSIEIPADAQEVITLAKAHLADHIGSSVSEIKVTEIEEVEWRNSSLGCPQPGMMYLQVITPGFRMVLEAGGMKYEYHSDKGKRVIHCQPAKGRKPLSAVATPYDPQSPVDIAKLDLADKEGITPEEIKVVSIEDVDWSDSSLGCPQPGMMYAQVITPGKRIILAIGEDHYEYHTDIGKRVVLCLPE